MNTGSKTIRLFYKDQYNREVSWYCTRREYNTLLIEFLEEHINSGFSLFVEKDGQVTQIDYYNGDRQ